LLAILRRRRPNQYKRGDPCQNRSHAILPAFAARGG
jgi:hypothetical protein